MRNRRNRLVAFAASVAVAISLIAVIANQEPAAVAEAKPIEIPITTVAVDRDENRTIQEHKRSSRNQQRQSVAATKTEAPLPTEAAPAPQKPAPQKPKPAKRVEKPESVPAAPGGGAAAVVAYVKAQVGKRYVWATSGPNTFDCSGLVVAAYRRIGINLPHQTGGLTNRGRAVSRSQLMPGDLVFPSSGHVGIYIGGGMMVHASNPKSGVKLSTIYTFSYARRIL